VLAAALLKPEQPLALGVFVAVGPAQDGACTVDERHAKIAVAVLGDSLQCDAAAGAVAAWDHAQPRGDIAPTTELLAAVGYSGS
jgi:hypothetical protein